MHAERAVWPSATARARFAGGKVEWDVKDEEVVEEMGGYKRSAPAEPSSSFLSPFPIRPDRRSVRISTRDKTLGIDQERLTGGTFCRFESGVSISTAELAAFRLELIVVRFRSRHRLEPESVVANNARDSAVTQCR